MSQENVEMMRRAYEAYNRGDIDGGLSDFAPDCRYTAAGTIPDRTGVFHGREGYRSHRVAAKRVRRALKPRSTS